MAYINIKMIYFVHIYRDKSLIFFFFIEITPSLCKTYARPDQLQNLYKALSFISASRL